MRQHHKKHKQSKTKQWQNKPPQKQLPRKWQGIDYTPIIKNYATRLGIEMREHWFTGYKNQHKHWIFYELHTGLKLVEYWPSTGTWTCCYKRGKEMNPKLLLVIAYNIMKDYRQPLQKPQTEDMDWPPDSPEYSHLRACATL